MLKNQILMAFPTSWEGEPGFSQISIIKTEYRNRLQLEPDARIALSIPEPDIKDFVYKKQAHKSH